MTPIKPAEYIRDEIAARGWSHEHLARLVGTTTEGIDHLVACRVKIDEELARRLARAFGTDAQLWLNLQSACDHDFERFAAKLLKDLRKLRSDVQQIVNDFEWWNDNRLDAPPFDLECEKQMLPKIDEAIRCVESRQRIPDGLWNDVISFAEEAAQS